MSNLNRTVTNDSKKSEDSLLNVFRALNEENRNKLLDYAAELQGKQSGDQEGKLGLDDYNRKLASLAEDRSTMRFR